MITASAHTYSLRGAPDGIKNIVPGWAVIVIVDVLKMRLDSVCVSFRLQIVFTASNACRLRFRQPAWLPWRASCITKASLFYCKILKYCTSFFLHFWLRTFCIHLKVQLQHRLYYWPTREIYKLNLIKIRLNTAGLHLFCICVADLLW